MAKIDPLPTPEKTGDIALTRQDFVDLVETWSGTVKESAGDSVSLFTTVDLPGYPPIESLRDFLDSVDDETWAISRRVNVTIEARGVGPAKLEARLDQTVDLHGLKYTVEAADPKGKTHLLVTTPKVAESYARDSTKDWKYFLWRAGTRLLFWFALTFAVLLVMWLALGKDTETMLKSWYLVLILLVGTGPAALAPSFAPIINQSLPVVPSVEFLCDDRVSRVSRRLAKSWRRVRTIWGPITVILAVLGGLSALHVI